MKYNTISGNSDIVHTTIYEHTTKVKKDKEERLVTGQPFFLFTRQFLFLCDSTGREKAHSFCEEVANWIL